MEYKEREIWIDNIKVVACMLVMLGHFFQSMIKSRILPDTDVYQWFKQTIYLFHVSLFFICSGYLYQRHSKVDTMVSWYKNIKKKLLVLGVPYFTFTILTYLLKTVFSSSVNEEMSNGILNTLFITPTAPYWYLYTLFFIFLFTPTVKSQLMMVVMITVSLLFKAASLLDIRINAIYYILSYEIWFVIGMLLSVINVKKILNNANYIVVGFLLLLFFVGASIISYVTGNLNDVIGFLLGIVACLSIIVITVTIFSNNVQNKLFGFLAVYTMPIFLMHTLFAAPIRIILLKMGINNPVVHIVLGVLISIIGPILMAELMKKTKLLEFFIYPNKIVKI